MLTAQAIADLLRQGACLPPSSNNRHTRSRLLLMVKFRPSFRPYICICILHFPNCCVACSGSVCVCRLDSLVGLFAAKCAPTATADPYGLRRSAVGMLQALMAADARLDLVAAVDAAAAVQPIAVGAESRAAVLEFVERRLEQMLLDAGVQIEAVRAALRERGRDAALAARTAREIAVSGWARH